MNKTEYNFKYLKCLMSRVQKMENGRKWLGREDSNPRMPGPEPGALPLGDAPINWYFQRDNILHESSGVVNIVRVQGA